MITKITVTKKNVCYENKRFHLCYRLLKRSDFCYGIEVSCADGNTTEADHIWVGKSYGETIKLLHLFAEETVFPVALKETYDNL